MSQPRTKISTNHQGEVDPLVHNMSTESPGEIKYSEIGGLAEQICELREVKW